MSIEVYWIIAPLALIGLSAGGWLALWITRPGRLAHQEQKR